MGGPRGLELLAAGRSAGQSQSVLGGLGQHEARPRQARSSTRGLHPKAGTAAQGAVLVEVAEEVVEQVQQGHNQEDGVGQVEDREEEERDRRRVQAERARRQAVWLGGRRHLPTPSNPAEESPQALEMSWSVGAPAPQTLGPRIVTYHPSPPRS